MPTINLSGCFGLEVTSWTCSTAIPSSSCVTFSPLFPFFNVMYLLRSYANDKKKVAVGHKDGTACLSSPPPPLHDISSYNPGICSLLVKKHTSLPIVQHNLWRTLVLIRTHFLLCACMFCKPLLNQNGGFVRTPSNPPPCIQA